MLQRFLLSLEQWGNKIPHPSLMFFWLCVLMFALSIIGKLFSLQVTHPANDTLIMARSLASAEGLRFMLTGMVDNFISFAPLGVVLVAMLGIGIAEKSGLLASVLQRTVRAAKPRLLTFIVAFTGVMSSMAADAGYVILIPLSAMLFVMAGRSAMAGIATAFAGVSAGYSANLLVGPIDAILAGISTEAARTITADAHVSAAANWYFNILSTFVIAALITWITEKKQWQHSKQLSQEVAQTRYSLKGQVTFSTAYILALAILLIPESAPLRHPETGTIANSPFINAIVIIIALYFAGAGLIFGYINRTFRQAADVIHAMESTMAALAPYLVMMFFAAQFIAWFQWSNLGLMLAVGGAQWLGSLDINHYLLLLIFILLNSLINIFIGSASAQWALMAPIFVPMFMLMGISPDVIQAAYRIGDSSSNIISPMMPYFALVLGFVQQYDNKAGIGTLITVMLPYALALLVIWSSLLLIYLALALPLGI